MNLAETQTLLTLAKSIDNRDFDDATVIAWQQILADVDEPDATKAVLGHFASSRDYLMPVHVRDGAEQHRRNRIRTLREQREADERHALEAAPRTDRRTEIAAFIRGINGPGDPDKLRSREARWRRQRIIHRDPTPNPHFVGFPYPEEP